MSEVTQPSPIKPAWPSRQQQRRKPRKPPQEEKEERRGNGSGKLPGEQQPHIDDYA